jgi:triacylglycerol esterase/lipase EstA (alpha/beta hydrolase family)
MIIALAKESCISIRKTAKQLPHEQAASHTTAIMGANSIRHVANNVQTHVANRKGCGVDENEKYFTSKLTSSQFMAQCVP